MSREYAKRWIAFCLLLPLAVPVLSTQTLAQKGGKGGGKPGGDPPPNPAFVVTLRKGSGNAKPTTTSSNGDSMTSLSSSGATAAWSPDGRWIVYVDGRDLFAVRPGGSNVNRVFTLPDGVFIDGGSGLHWFPDGTRLLASEADSNRADLVVIDLVRGTMTALNVTEAHPLGTQHGTIGPDLIPETSTYEGLLAYRAFNPATESNDLYAAAVFEVDGDFVVDLDSITAVVEAAGHQRNPDWSSDGSTLAYVDELEPGVEDLRIVTVDIAADGIVSGTSQFVHAANDFLPYAPVTWSPDGAWLGFIEGPQRLGLIRPDGSDYHTVSFGKNVRPFEVHWNPLWVNDLDL